LLQEQVHKPVVTEMATMLTSAWIRMVLPSGAPANTWVEQLVQALPARVYSPIKLHLATSLQEYQLPLPVVRIQLVQKHQ